MCSATRYLVIGGLLGVGAASLTGRDAVGWAVGLAGVVLLLVLERAFPARFGPSDCAVPTGADAVGDREGDRTAVDPVRVRGERAAGVEPPA